MQSEFLIGVDGGGTHCRTRLTTPEGRILAECTGGAANVYSDFSGAIDRVNTLIDRTFFAANLPVSARSKTHAVWGLAGANVPSVGQRLQQQPSDFARLSLFSDVDIACAGAHQGKAGAVLIAGTGSQGAAWDGTRFHRVGGWGFSLADQGSGALLGQRALRKSLQAHDGIIAATPLTEAIMRHFSHSPDALLSWTRQATPGDWGHFSPWVFDASQQGDSLAAKLITETAAEVTELLDALARASHGSLALMGGMAAPLLPWLAEETRTKIVPAQQDALSGALLLASLC
ncbi:BadF/BadG/BcrA/BcrD ATPase family protein [Erwinia sp.]|uniref:BadF/BadG/BcrA/BcrD ATPase family protein n=1 Tax=Erwinia citreus TaxID=558 RepID=UPI003C75A399